MSKEKPPASKPKLVTLDKAFKLAESWVNNMSGTAADDLSEVQFEGRQPRRLRAKLETGKRRTAKSIEESHTPAEDDDDSDDDPESRTNAFTKKRVIPVIPSLHTSKKRK
ncbi:hypothetical protein IFM89_013488 [Coptis chinensis]|uniref:Uncharacterized protein n=1 Tax=Coptis chinensis TaxID=261450 RepID=A0A835ICD2_9MAGN|nr:hypothetical protein IFM89_013488 [Coptis chinensis]